MNHGDGWLVAFMSVLIGFIISLFGFVVLLLIGKLFRSGSRSEPS